MAVAPNRKQIEIPRSLWEALDIVARRQDMPTGAMVAVWLWEQLERKARTPGDPAEGVHAPQPYHQENILPRRGEISHMQQVYAAKLEEHAAYIENERDE